MERRSTTAAAAASSAAASTSCALCEGSNLASICTSCVNHKLIEYSTSLKSLKATRVSLYDRLSQALEAKRKADDHHQWRILQNNKVTNLKERLLHLRKQLVQDKTKIKKVSNELKVKQELLKSASELLKSKRVELLEKSYPNHIHTQNLCLMAITSERLQKQSVILTQICKLFPMCLVNLDEGKRDGTDGSYDQICDAHLPRGLDPNSVPSEELAASLGYMVQLMNIVVPILAAPALHNSGFAGSCSRIWQRDSYWEARPSSQSKEYSLFILRQNFCSTGGENSWSDRSSSSSVVSPVQSKRKSYPETIGSSGFNYSSASPHSVQNHKDVQKGISLLKRSVSCVTAYCYNSLVLDAPSNLSTFGAFAKLLVTLSSSGEASPVSALKMVGLRSCKQDERRNKSRRNANSKVSSSSLVKSTHTSIMPSTCESHLSNSTVSFLCSADMPEYRIPESLAGEWDIVECPNFPPPPSQIEDIEHWTRAMFTDATKPGKQDQQPNKSVWNIIPRFHPAAYWRARR